MKKGQMAVDFIYAYGWAMISVLVVIVTTVNYIAGTYGERYCPPGYGITNDQFLILDQVVLGNDTEFAPARNMFSLVVHNNLFEQVRLQKIKIKRGDIECGHVIVDSRIDAGESSGVVSGWITNPDCYLQSGQCYWFDVDLIHESIHGLWHTTNGIIGGLTEATSSEWDIPRIWHVENYSMHVDRNQIVIRLEDRGGELINYCDPETPPIFNHSGMSLPPDYYYWNLPKNAGPINVEGFDLVPCDPRSKLAKGWLQKKIFISDLFEEYSVMISGNATYYDAVLGKNMTNGICIDDNIYFYLNGNMSHYGGTLGYKGSDPDVWEDGDEVVENCGNCFPISQKMECVPAFNMTAAGFVFGVYNNLSILVEDYSKGGGKLQAGGMSWPKIELI